MSQKVSHVKCHVTFNTKEQLSSWCDVTQRSSYRRDASRRDEKRPNAYLENNSHEDFNEPEYVVNLPNVQFIFLSSIIVITS